MSPMASQMAEQWGYTLVKVYHDGVPDWKKNGNILLTTQQYLSEEAGYYVLIDTRGSEAAESGHIPGAVAITAEDIPEVKGQFPLDRKVPIVLYAEQTNSDALKPVVQTIAAWGYKSVVILEGGYQAWTAAGREIKKETPPTSIVYIPKPHPGEIVKDEFAMIIQERPEDALILDVRNPDEAASGALPGSVNIPLDEIELRKDELPRDKEIIIHCSTGMRAEMAYKMLKKAGFDTRFYNNNISIVGKKVYLGTTVKLSEDTVSSETLASQEIEIATPDADLCARLIRHGKNAFERRRYQQAKKLFWKAIMADPTSEVAWHFYDRSVIFALAERAENDPSCIGTPDVPVSTPEEQTQSLFTREEEGC
mgnify:FL=1